MLQINPSFTLSQSQAITAFFSTANVTIWTKMLQKRSTLISFAVNTFCYSKKAYSGLQGGTTQLVKRGLLQSRKGQRHQSRLSFEDPHLHRAMREFFLLRKHQFFALTIAAIEINMDEHSNWFLVAKIQKRSRFSLTQSRKTEQLNTNAVRINLNGHKNMNLEPL